MNPINIFTIDIPRYEIGQVVAIVGIVIEKKDFINGTYGIKIKDITGNAWCILDAVNADELSYYQNINKGSRINIVGFVDFNKVGNKVIKRIVKIEPLSTIKSDFSILDSEMKEQASRMLLIRICKKISTFFINYGYIEFESRLITKHWHEDSLEPLQVQYPGFGSPAFLILSPSPQVIDFMETTIVSKAFTISSSFTYSYRFPNGSSETKVIVSKAINLSMQEHKQLLLDISSKILVELNVKEVTPILYNGIWPDLIEGVLYFDKHLESELNIISFSANIPVIGKNWNTNIETIFQVLDKEKNILIEGAREKIGIDSMICTITIYPSQFLGLIEKAPSRQLQNLTRLYDGKS
jgi:hypothetical protein